MVEEVTVDMPLHLTRDMIEAVKNDPITSVEDKDEWHKRLGRLICVYEVMVRQRNGG